MRNLYIDEQEGSRHNEPSPRGNLTQINLFIGSDHAGDRKTDLSQT